MPRSHLLLLATCILASGVPQLHAQSTASDAAAKKSDDVIRLSEFNVSAGSDRGYVASESMTGTRVATKIGDLPFNVNVLTSDFFSDFAMFELNENLAYISSFSGLDQGGGYNLRGFNQSYQLRDGFFRLGRYGTSNVDRVEVIKGPNAAIYGQSQPGGMINMISKHPRSVARQEISISVGDYNTTRTTLESTGPIGNRGSVSPKLTYDVTLGSYERTYDTPGKALRNKEGYAALQYKFTPETSLLLTAEYFLREQHSPLNPIPYRYDPTDKSALSPNGRYEGIAYELATFNQNGPQAQLNRGINFVTAVFETRFSPVWSFRTGLNWGHAHNWNFNNVNQTQYYVAPSGTIPANSLSRSAPSKGLIDEVTFNVNADLLAHWWVFNHRVENRDLFTFDFADYYRWDPTWSLRSGVPYGPTRIVVGQPIDFTVPPYDTINYANGYGIPGNNSGRWRHNRASDWGDLYRHQSSFLSGRLLTYVGARYDEVKLRMRNYIGVPANAPVTLKDNLQRWSPNGGALYKATPNISVYGNYSTGYNPQVQNQDAKTPLPAETDWGYDYGVKTSFLDDRLNVTIGGYYITRRNVNVTEIDPQGNTFNAPEGNHLVRGEEVELNWRVRDNFSVGGSYGHVDSRITNDGRNFMSVGRSPARIPPQNLGVYGKYEWVSGALRGFSLNIGVIYVDKFHPESQNAGDTYTTVKDATGRVTGVTYTTNYQWALLAPSATVWNAGLRYTFSTSRPMRVVHTLGLNVNNAFDRFYISTARTMGDRRSFFFTYRISH